MRAGAGLGVYGVGTKVVGVFDVLMGWVVGAGRAGEGYGCVLAHFVETSKSSDEFLDLCRFVAL